MTKTSMIEKQWTCRTQAKNCAIVVTEGDEYEGC